jgi:serine/threonine-protein kinase
MENVCPECGEMFDMAIDVCPHDGTRLTSDPWEETNSLIGQTVDDRFRLDAILGEGGMGCVYEATQLSVDRQVALKLIQTGGAHDEEMAERFFREARAISGFTHPNIVQFIDFGRDDSLQIPYLAMEHVDGIELVDLIGEARFRPHLAVEIASQVAAGLVEAHDAEIVHRDLKPGNILLVPVSGRSFCAKIIDFGLAFSKESSMNLTKTGTVCGTPEYLSPEQARGEEVDYRADLYSLGVILFEMLTSRLPFQADSPFDVMLKHVDHEPPSIEEFAPDIPEDLTRLVDELLAKDPSARPDGGREIGQRIKRIRPQLDGEPLQIDSTRPLGEALDPWLIRDASPDIASAPTQAQVEAPDSQGASSVDRSGARTAADRSNARPAVEQSSSPARTNNADERKRTTQVQTTDDAGGDLETWGNVAVVLAVLLVGLGTAILVLERSGTSDSPPAPATEAAESAPGTKGTANSSRSADETEASADPSPTAEAPSENSGSSAPDRTREGESSAEGADSIDPSSDEAGTDSDDDSRPVDSAGDAGTASASGGPESPSGEGGSAPDDESSDSGAEDDPAESPPTDETEGANRPSSGADNNASSDELVAPSFDDEPESGDDPPESPSDDSSSDEALESPDKWEGPSSDGENSEDESGPSDESSDEDIDREFEKSVDWLTDE